MKFLFHLIFKALSCAIGRLRQKTLMFFVLWFALANLDAMVPAFNNSLTKVGLILGIPLVVMLYARMRYIYDGGVDEFTFATKYLFLGSLLGLLRAWSEAAGGGLSDTAASMFRLIFGNLGAASISALAEVFGYGDFSPMPLIHPEGWRHQLLHMPMVLTLASLATLVLAIASLLFILREFGGSRPNRTASVREALSNRLMPLWTANWRLGGLTRHSLRALRNLSRTPRIRDDELVIGMDKRRPFNPLALTQRSLGRTLTAAGMTTHLTALDPRSLIVAPCEGSAMFVAGAGSGKTQAWEVANQATIDAPLISFQNQGNAVEQEIPLRRALGRTPHLFDATLRTASASIHALAAVNPDAPDFAEYCSLLAQTQVDDGAKGEHGDLKERARALIACVIANNAAEAKAEDAVATMAEVYRDLCSPELIGRLRHWADHGPEDFRDDAGILAEDMDVDPQLVSNLRFFVGQMRWLGSPSLRALVCGETDHLVDPVDLVGDRGRCDWILQTTNPKLSTGLWRLLITVALHAHTKRTAGQARRAPRTTLMVGETFALGNFPLLGEVIELGRQKGLRAILLMQSAHQVNKIYGPGTFDEWAGSCHVLGFSRFNEPGFAAQVEAMAGETNEISSDRLNSPGGGLGGANKTWKPKPLLSKERLMRLPKFNAVVFCNDRSDIRQTLLVPMPVFFRHPSLSRWRDLALTKFPSATP